MERGCREGGTNPVWKRRIGAESQRTQSDIGEPARPTLYTEVGEVCRQLLWGLRTA